MMEVKFKLDKEAQNSINNVASAIKSGGKSNREEIQKIEDNELRFTVCTNSGTYINIPSGYIKLFITSTLILGSAAIILKTIDIIQDFKLNKK